MYTYGLVVAQLLDLLDDVQLRPVPDAEGLSFAVGQLVDEQRAARAIFRTESDDVRHRKLAYLRIRIRKER